MVNKNKEHVKIRNLIEDSIKEGLFIDEISEKFFIPIGTRFVKGSVRWYAYYIKAKQNQKKTIEKHPNLYSNAGKIAHQKHPWIGKQLGRKYGSIQCKINAERLRGNSEYFSKMAKRLHEINPEYSRVNIKKAHETMKAEGNFYEHQRDAALKCMEKNTNQLKEMSKIAHERYPLALLALESRRKNYPYEFMGCFFDSEQEKLLCKKFVDKGLIDKPIEKVNVHFRIRRCHIDFFIQNKLFIEFHPSRKFGRKIETEESYFKERRMLLDKNGFENYPLIVIGNLKEIEEKINEIRILTQIL